MHYRAQDFGFSGAQILRYQGQLTNATSRTTSPSRCISQSQSPEDAAAEAEIGPSVEACSYKPTGHNNVFEAELTGSLWFIYCLISYMVHITNPLQRLIVNETVGHPEPSFRSRDGSASKVLQLPAQYHDHQLVPVNRNTTHGLVKFNTSIQESVRHTARMNQNNDAQGQPANKSRAQPDLDSALQMFMSHPKFTPGNIQMNSEYNGPGFAQHGDAKDHAPGEASRSHFYGHTVVGAGRNFVAGDVSEAVALAYAQENRNQPPAAVGNQQSQRVVEPLKPGSNVYKLSDHPGYRLGADSRGRQG